MKTVGLITGANRGLGFETARQLSHLGVHVLLGARELGAAEQAAEAIRAEGGEATGLQLDVTRAEEREAARELIEQRFSKLDILVNNGAISDGGFPVKEPERWASGVEDELLHRIFETNFFGAVALTNKLIPLLKLSTAGRVVNLSSIVGSLTLHQTPGSPIFNSKSLAYGASKTALNAYTVHLAWEMRRTKIKVNSADPGWVKTRMGGPNAALELAEGAATIVRLATLPEDGPTGGFFHNEERRPW
jgi:NAD(P)-dependent dehydrogenase (short-subunit alcohol dehydrogenase family)